MPVKKIIHPTYRDYAEPPYISPERDLAAWEQTPERFPYSKVEKKQMERLPEGILPGHIIMLWRIHFNNITTETIMPQYFEYRYGVDSDECIATLTALGYIYRCDAKDSVNLLNAAVLKRILVSQQLDGKGKKAELLERILLKIPEEALANCFAMRRYQITPEGMNVLQRYDDIIQRHGPKM